MSNKRASVELVWASIAGAVGWVGSVFGSLAVVALVVLVGMAGLIAATTIHGAFTRGAKE